MDPIFRHVAQCNNAVLPGKRRPLRIEGQAVGFVLPDVLPVLERAGFDPRLDGTASALGRAAQLLAEAERFRPRGEAFDVRAAPGGAVLATVDRGALPLFGIGAVGVHLNGMVERVDGPWMWVARRAMNKPLDPGKLDHLVGGGVPAGLSPAETLLKEAEEEAGLPGALARQATAVAVIDYAADRTEGLRRDRLHCFDLALPPSWQPRAVDGEVAGFELWPLGAVLERVRNTDDFKFNVNLVLIDLFQRRGLLEATPAAPPAS